MTDPFGVFKYNVLDWDSYEYTMNPRTAKFTYLDEVHDDYDSYIIGSSAASGIPVESLNKHLDARFYNSFIYGADMYDAKKISDYFIDNYEVKNLVLCINVVNAVKYNVESNPLTDNLHYKVDGASMLEFYNKYLFANPQFGFEKTKLYFQDSYVQDSYDVFNVETGSYDKSKRDIERIQDLDSYLKEYSEFVNYPVDKRSLDFTDEFLCDVKDLVARCKENDINLIVTFFPLYYQYADYYDQEEVTKLYKELSEITDFWDFSLSDLSVDPRFFYDASHFRNVMGEMAVARIFNDKDIYIPEDFGVYVTKDNAEQQAALYGKEFILDDINYTKEVPILMYHHLDEVGDGELVITEEHFEEQIRALNEAGYEGVSLQQLEDYTKKGIELPEKPIVITFDDGYLSNYTIAYPILQKYNMKATMFLIGCSVGKDTYKDTEYAMKPHYSFDQAKEMSDSGLIEIQSHTYDMHQWGPFENENTLIRPTAVRQESESEEEYIATFREDIIKSKNDIVDATGKSVFALAYPSGKYDDLSEILLSEMDITVTLSTVTGKNTIIKGLPQSLRALKRFAISDTMTPEEILLLIE